MNGRLHPDHENRTGERDPHHRAPLGHIGAFRRFHLCFLSLIRRGGAPSGAAGSFARGGREVLNPHHHI